MQGRKVRRFTPGERRYLYSLLAVTRVSGERILCAGVPCRVRAPLPG